MTKASTPPAPGRNAGPGRGSFVRDLISRVTRLEIIVGSTIALVMASLVIIEPNILQAPFQNSRTLLFTFGGTALAAIAFAVMLRLGVPPVVRVIVLVVPLVIVNWWLISPYFVDESVDDAFSTSISQQLGAPDEASATTVTPGDDPASTSDSVAPTTEAPPATEPEPVPEEPPATGEQPPTAEEQPPATDEEPASPAGGPVLLAAGQFVGLAGHSGTGDAGIFQNPDGSLVLRFENFDIENGPDLEVYLVPGADQVSLPAGSIHLGELKGNMGDQNYDLPPGTDLQSGPYTVLVWCEAFSVEFVGATINV